MKKTIWIIVIVAIVALFALTCPTRVQHKDAIMNKISAVAEKKISETTGDGDFAQGLAVLGSMLANKLIEVALDTKLNYQNYFLFSMGKIEYEGEMKTISVGLLNQIFTFSEEDLEEIIEKGTME